MSIRTYILNGKNYYEVWTSRRGTNGSRVRKKTKFDSNRKRISSKQVALEIEHEIVQEVKERIKDPNNWTWKNWQKEALRQMRYRHKESTVKNYECLINKWVPPNWENKKISEINKSDVSDWIFEYIPSCKKATTSVQKELLRRVKRILEMALEEGVISRNPAIGLSVKVAKAEQKVLNSNEVNILLHASSEYNHRFYYHWTVALFTGMRNGELYSLRWSDVDLSSKLISISRQWTSKDGLHETKSNRNRVVPICPELNKILIELKNIGPFSEKLWIGVNNLTNSKKNRTVFNDLVLPRNKDWRLGMQASALKSFCKSLGITPVKFHDLRATFITNLLSEGVPLAKVMSIVGHSEVKTTNEYLRLSGVDIKSGTTEMLKFRTPKVTPINLLTIKNFKTA